VSIRLLHVADVETAYDDPDRIARLAGGLRAAGTDLRDVLRAAGATHLGDRGRIPFHVSGLRVRWRDDGTLAAVRTPAGPLRAERTYRVAASHYLRRSEDFPALSEANAVAEGPPQYEALLAYVRETGAIPEVEGRIERGRGADRAR
jgi:hypothetical protein